MQFHPTTLKSNGVLITEGCRGEGGYLRNANGDRFMAEAAPNAMELASRDVVSRAEWKEIEEGRGVDGCVLLDLTHLGAKKIHARLPGSRELAMDYAGVDPILEPIPVRPGAHYHMGGVDADVDGRTLMPGLYAAGECACVSVHGANRLGGNSLMETITFGRRAGSHAGARRDRAPQRRARRRLAGARRRRAHPLDLRALGRPAAVAGARGARDRDVRLRRHLPHAGAPRALPDDDRRAARARRRRRRRRHGRPLQHRPALGLRARVDARDGRLPRHRRARAPGVARRAHAPRLPASATTSAG